MFLKIKQKIIPSENRYLLLSAGSGSGSTAPGITLSGADN
jgi:hypothetical protein